MSSLRPTGLWQLQLGGWLAFGTAMGLGRIGEMPGLAILLIDGPFALLGFASTLLLAVAYRRWRVADGSTLRAVSGVAISSWVVAMLWTALFHRYLHGIAVPTITAVYPGIVLPVRRGPVLDNTVYNTLTMLAWSLLYLGLAYRDQIQAQRDQALHALAEAKDAQLRMLAYQLNPHFLFNTLNSLRTLIAEDRNRAQRMVTELARFLRYALVERPQHLAPLDEELQAVRGYLAIEAIRFEEHLDVQIAVTPDAARCRVPGFLLNPLVENAIKHGRPVEPGAPLRIRIAAQVIAGPQLEVVVENSGRLRGHATDADPASGVGLRNVRARLQHHYADAHRFTLEEEEGRVRAMVRIPAVRDGAPSSHAPDGTHAH